MLRSIEYAKRETNAPPNTKKSAYISHDRLIFRLYRATQTSNQASKQAHATPHLLSDLKRWCVCTGAACLDTELRRVFVVPFMRWVDRWVLIGPFYYRYGTVWWRNGNLTCRTWWSGRKRSRHKRCAPLYIAFCLSATCVLDYLVILVLYRWRRIFCMRNVSLERTKMAV